MSASGLTPITVLTGFLGSGKTTLLNRLLADPRYADTAVVVNEFGDIAIDHALVRKASENVVLLPSGCVCCRVAGDLVQALRDLHFARARDEVPAFRRVVLETTGLADPAPILATLVEMPLVAARYALAGVVTTVDGEFGAATLDAHPEAVKQAAVADRLVLTKVDRASPEALEALATRLAALNPAAPLVRSTLGDADPALLLEAGLSRAGRTRTDVKRWLGEGQWRSHAPATPAGVHDARIRTFSWILDDPVTDDALETAVETLVDLLGDRILRLKGLVHLAGEPGPLAIHAVQHTLYPSARLAAWHEGARATHLVFIGRDLEESAVVPILESFLSPA